MHRLDLAVEVALPGVFPAAVLGDERDRVAHRRRGRVKTEDLQSLQSMHRRRPWLPRLTAGVGPRETGAAVPQPVDTLQRQKTRPPALPLHPRPLRGDLARRSVGQITQHLPADSRIRLEQPIDH